MIGYIGLGVGIIAAVALGYLIGRIPRTKKEEEIIASAQEEAERLKRERILEARQEIQEMREEFEARTKRREEELARMEERILQREDRLGKKSTYLERIEDSLRADEEELQRLKEEGERLLAEEKAQLARISGWTEKEAQEHLLKLVETESQRFFSRKVEEVERRAKEEAQQRAARILATAVQRYAGEYIEENAVSSVPLPSEEFKGRIIGREGRNIRTFEALTGVELLVDDTPEMVVLSSFHPLRREVARLALTRLIEDGRIHPAQIEEKVQRAKARLADQIREEGRKAAFDLGLDLHPELTALLGRLKYRTSYGQNQLAHSVEVAWIAKMIAEELGIDAVSAKRAGLLHDIGKAVDHEVEGPHALIGADLARRYGEKSVVVHAIAAHHEDVDPESVLDVIIQAADTLSAARPGARHETFERYIQRLKDLEALCRSFPAVQEAYALQAGREVRVMVHPDRASDEVAAKLAYDIARAIEEELNYPGEIKVNVIRQTQFTQSAK
ncbi:ribonuclease Y [Candidatus Acetothermia bacterium]|nr:ribonuclease Y [Candidatus Bipolaricaulota bacterium]RLE39910.1 MAG: ribonuclease Y [Candidatus Acetothermia bacterium]